MVQKHRCVKNTITKDVSPMRPMKEKNLPSKEVSRKDRSAAATGTDDKWKFSKMVTTDRKAFNDLHFC